MQLKVNSMENKFLNKYLVSNLRINDIKTKLENENQLFFEQELRKEIIVKKVQQPIFNKDCENWSYYYNHNSYFVNLGTFYSTLKKVEFDAVTDLIVDDDCELDIMLWSYSAITVWCNEELVGSLDVPVYKPINQKKCKIKLKKGLNRIFITLQTLGVRDTRSLFGLSIDNDEIKWLNKYPIITDSSEIDKYIKFLDEVKIEEGVIKFPFEAPTGTSVGIDSLSNDYAKNEIKIKYNKVDNFTSYTHEKEENTFIITIDLGFQKLTRKIQDYSFIKPKYQENSDVRENSFRIYKNIAEHMSLSRGGKFGFAIPNILARKATNLNLFDDEKLLYETLDQIEARYDCSDFLISGIIRYINNYSVSDEMMDRIKEVFLNYRYWMNMKGMDGMCFWSENHALLFYSAAYQIGEMYPKEYFPRADMSGEELSKMGRDLVDQWLDDVLIYGLEEFHSIVYLTITFTALVNIYDYSDSILQTKTKAVLDSIFTQLCWQTYDNTIFAPMGRVYRQIIEPFNKGSQAFVNLINTEAPIADGEGWISFFATTKYKMPMGLKELMKTPMTKEYCSGNAKIYLQKRENYCLTSVQSPRMDNYKRWDNLTLNNTKFEVSSEYTKSLNERFHGTSNIEPGVFGYQQHLWSVALTNEAFVFSNHPGVNCDDSDLRPGYWYGNGVLPAIKQDENKLALIYSIPKDHPIQFIHLFFPQKKFDKVEHQNNWIFATKAKGVMAIWCSDMLHPYNDMLFDCEYRCNNNKSSLFVVVDENIELEEFKKNCFALHPEFDVDALSLSLNNKSFLGYEECKDVTQFV